MGFTPHESDHDECEGVYIYDSVVDFRTLHACILAIFSMHPVTGARRDFFERKYWAKKSKLKWNRHRILYKKLNQNRIKRKKPQSLHHLLCH